MDAGFWGVSKETDGLWVNQEDLSWSRQDKVWKWTHFLKGSRDLQKDNQSWTCSAITAPPSLEKLVQKEDLSTLVLMQPGKLHLPKFRCLHWVKGETRPLVYETHNSSAEKYSAGWQFPPGHRGGTAPASTSILSPHSSKVMVPEDAEPPSRSGILPLKGEVHKYGTTIGRCTHAENVFYLFTDAQCPVHFIHYISYPLTFLSPLLLTWKGCLYSEQEIQDPVHCYYLARCTWWKNPIPIPSLRISTANSCWG